jgi:hypothetical protein
MNLRRLGGAAALLMAAAYLIGIALNFTVLDTTGIADPIEEIGFLVRNQTIMSIWILFIYVVFGALLVVLALALHALVQDDAPDLARVATAFGLIWACLLIGSGMVYKLGLETVATLYRDDAAVATTVMAAITAVHEGLGGANEIPGGLWTLLISTAALRTGRLPRGLGILGLLIGAAGVFTVIQPFFPVAAAIFGIGGIVWFIWLSAAMLRAVPAPEARVAVGEAGVTH